MCVDIREYTAMLLITWEVHMIIERALKDVAVVKMLHADTVNSI